MSVYDSAADTNDHIKKVRLNIVDVMANLYRRKFHHDESKLEEPEKSAFDLATPKLKGMAYGSDEYRAILREIKPALDHHYSFNDHHPEHFSDGIRGMSLMAIMEMLCDWRAAGQRHDPPTPFEKSIAINIDRFKIPQYFSEIIRNTALELGWE